MLIKAKPKPITKFKDLKPGEIFTMSGSSYTYIKLENKLQTEFAINGVITAIALNGGTYSNVEDNQTVTHYPGAYVGFNENS